jgi:hypothetical protein
MELLGEHVILYNEFMKYVKYINEFGEIAKQKNWTYDIYIQKLKYLMTPNYVNKIDSIRKKVNILFNKIINNNIIKDDLKQEYHNMDKRINLITNALIKLYQNKFLLNDKEILEYYYQEDIEKQILLLDLPNVPNNKIKSNKPLIAL